MQSCSNVDVMRQFFYVLTRARSSRYAVRARVFANWEGIRSYPISMYGRFFSVVNMNFVCTTNAMYYIFYHATFRTWIWSNVFLISWVAVLVTKAWFLSGICRKHGLSLLLVKEILRFYCVCDFKRTLPCILLIVLLDFYWLISIEMKAIKPINQ